MSVLRGIRSEFIKLRHTSWLHIFIPMIGAAVFLLYFALYPQVEGSSKMAFVLELTAIIFSIVISVVCGMMAAMEEKAAGFQVMISNKDGRIIPYLNKLLTAVLLGGFSTVLLAGITLFGSSILSLAQLSYREFALAALGMFAGSIPLYVIHMFLSMKWGLGGSVFVGVIGSLLSIMFSNVDVAIWSFIPFTWGIKILQNIIHAETTSRGIELPIVFGISAIILFFSFIWFQRWEGRKSFE